MLGFLRGYKDSDSMLVDAEMNIIKASGMDDQVYWGWYENIPWEWVVIGKDDTMVMLMSLDVLRSTKRFHETWEPREWPDGTMTWKNSSLREWMNTTYFTEAFTDLHRDKMLATEVVDTKETSQDHVYLMDRAMFETLPKPRRIAATYTERTSTDYRTWERVDNEYWWLRSEWTATREPILVDSGGELMLYNSAPGYGGYYVRFPSYSVRPVIKVSLSD